MGAEVGALDWVIVALYLTVSISVGIFCGQKSQGGSSTEYLLAGKSMNGFVVAISSLGGSYSAVSLIGSSGWAFVDGMAATFAGFLVLWPSTILMAELWVPIYRGLPNVVSCYQFLETRFSQPVRTSVSVMGNFSVLCYIATVLYAPALAISSLVPALGIYYTIFALGTACSVYTGIKTIVFDFEGVSGSETAMAPFMAASIATINFQVCRQHNPYLSLCFTMGGTGCSTNPRRRRHAVRGDLRGAR